MSNAKRQLHLNAFIMANGHHEAAWRHPDTDPKQALTLQHCAEIAQTAERGKLDSLDHLSGGRAGWNIVTSAGNEEAQNFNRDSRPDHELRYERATEFIEVAKKLWDSWDDDAAVIDKASGIYADPDLIHSINHVGRHFKVAGPLNTPRPVQGYPLLVQAGSSETGTIQEASLTIGLAGRRRQRRRRGGGGVTRPFGR